MATAHAHALVPPVSRGQRDHSRARLNLPARYTTFNGTEPCSVIDMSCTGAKIGARNLPRVGAMLVVEGLPLELFGTVRWTMNGFFGFEFDAPLPTDTVVQLRFFADGEDQRQKEATISYVRGWVNGVE